MSMEQPRDLSQRYCLGIDLGTTNTVAAVWEKGAEAPRPLPITQPMGGFSSAGHGRDELLPSAVLLESADHAFVGKAVKQVARLREERVVTSIKRFMGKRWRPSFEDFDHDWTPEVISGCILRAIRNEVVEYFGHLPERLVVGVPASFGVEARRSTLRAVELAGFSREPTQLLDEPTAALVHLIRGSKLDLHGGPKRMMMVDIGGGTLDVSMLEAEDKPEGLVADVFGASRYNELAGDDFDQNIAGLLLHRYELETNNAYSRCEDENLCRMFLMHLLNRAEVAKKELSTTYARHASKLRASRMRVTVSIERAPHGGNWSHSLSMDDLNNALQEFFYLDKSNVDANRNSQAFFTAIQQCLDSAASNKSNFVYNPVNKRYPIDHVFLTGGSASLPMLDPAIVEFLRKEPILVDDPFRAVAMGAAWFAGATHYDERPVKLIQRLYDALYLMDENDRLKLLLEPHQLVPLNEPREFMLRMPEKEFRLELNFFSGRPALDGTIDDISPLVTRVFEFPDSVPFSKDHELTLLVSINDNRELQFVLKTEVDGQTIQRRGKASVGMGASGRMPESLPKVNRPKDERRQTTETTAELVGKEDGT